MKKFGSFFTLLTSKGYKKVVLIPLAFCLGFFLYSLYKNFTGGDIDKTVYDDGTTRISAQSDLGSVKLPKILDSLNIPIHDDLKIRNYDVLLDKDENITTLVFLNLHKDEIFDCFALKKVMIKNELNVKNSQVTNASNLKILPVRFMVEFKPKSAIIGTLQ